MLWVRTSLAILFCHVALPVAAQDEKSEPSVLYQCPAYLQLGPNPHALKTATIFDGPIEDRASLVPELVLDTPQSPFWKYQATDRTLYVKCIYEDTGHYTVLEAKGASQCTHHATVLAVSVQCE